MTLPLAEASFDVDFSSIDVHKPSCITKATVQMFLLLFHRDMWTQMFWLCLHWLHLESLSLFFQSKNQGVTFDNITAPEVPCTSTPQDSRYSQSPKILCCFFLTRIIGSKYLWVTFKFLDNLADFKWMKFNCELFGQEHRKWMWNESVGLSQQWMLKLLSCEMWCCVDR